MYQLQCFRNKSAQMKLEKLDNELKNHKSNSIKVNTSQAVWIGGSQLLNSITVTSSQVASSNNITNVRWLGYSLIK